MVRIGWVRLFRFIVLLAVIGLLVAFSLGTESATQALAQGETPPGTRPALRNSPNFSMRTLTTQDGVSLDEYIINGPPHPLPGYEAQRQAAESLGPNLALGSNMLTVPAFDWYFGCSATSGAMIAAYYDRNGFPNMYTGPTNGGVMPLYSSVWGYWTDGSGMSYAQCPLTASRNGLDGRTTPGSIDDYWVEYGSSAQDPYITNGWTQHIWGTAIGDYMHTSQSAFGNIDGSTVFYTYSNNPAPLTCTTLELAGYARDGTVGRRKFYEARGYTVTDCYNQKTDNNGGGFTFAMYKAEIDAGRPVMINVAGHTMVGVGYDDIGNTVYLHDTWGFSTTSMPWGGSYEDMVMLSVSIVNLVAPCATPTLPVLLSPPGGSTTNASTPDFDWTDSTNATEYNFQLDNNADFSSMIVDTTTPTSAYTSTPALGNGTYYWQVRAHNSLAGCNIYSNWTAPASFTVHLKPGYFDKSWPGNGLTDVTTSPALSWGTSANATGYQYCIAKAPSCASWTSTTATNASLSGLDPNSTYYWHVRAVSGALTTYSNGDDPAAFWSFTTLPPPKTVTLAVDPAAQSVSIEQNFTWDIKVIAGAQAVDSASAYLNFDPAVLQVVQVTPGSALPEVVQNAFDNLTGQVNFSANATDSRPSGTFTLATVTFHAVTATPLTALTFNTLAPRQSDVTYFNASVLASSTGGNVEITMTAFIDGSVTLQGRPTPPGPRWSVPLTVTLTLPGEPAPSYTFTPTTDTSGHFIIAEILPDTYEVRVKNNLTLRNVMTMALGPGANPIDFGALLAGDADNDNAVNASDYMLLQPAYGKCLGTPGFDAAADFNGDACVTLLDFSLLATNYGKTGDITPEMIVPTVPGRLEADGLVLSVDPPTSAWMVGDTFTATIRLQTDGRPLDGVQVSLDFNPRQLRITQVSANPALLPEVLQNEYNNTAGTLDYAAGTFAAYPETGTYDLVQIQFEVIGAATWSGLSFHHPLPRSAEAADAGFSVLDGHLDGVVRSGFSTFVPTIKR